MEYQPALGPDQQIPVLILPWRISGCKSQESWLKSSIRQEAMATGQGRESLRGQRIAVDGWDKTQAALRTQWLTSAVTAEDRTAAAAELPTLTTQNINQLRQSHEGCQARPRHRSLTLPHRMHQARGLPHRRVCSWRNRTW